MKRASHPRLPSRPLCPKTGKRTYFVEAEAAFLGRELGQRAYRCDLCPYWHLTTQKRGAP